MTWFIDAIHVAPLIVITAPKKHCGKSQLLFLLGRLVKQPLPTSINPYKNWSGRKDLNLRPLAPHASTLPGCATPREGG